jgi:hypothetical protein
MGLNLGCWKQGQERTQTILVSGMRGRCDQDSPSIERVQILCIHTISKAPQVTTHRVIFVFSASIPPCDL